MNDINITGNRHSDKNKIREQQQQQQQFYGPLSGTTQVSRYQKKHSHTHTSPDNQPSFINFHRLLQHIASSSLQFLWSTSWSSTLHFILRTFLYAIIVEIAGLTAAYQPWGPHEHNSLR